jgi:hypothetical protein
MKKAPIIGISGQDGAYLASLRIRKGCHGHEFSYFRDWETLGFHSMPIALKKTATAFSFLGRAEGSPDHLNELGFQNGFD